MNRFAGKVVLVTGGTSGIGEAVARRVGAEGGDVFIAGRRRVLGQAVAADIRRSGTGVWFVPADMTVEADVQRLVAAVLTAFGRLDAAFNNAGATSPTGPIRETSATDWRREIDANLTTVFHSLKYELPAMTNGGSIVNNASIAAVRGAAGLAAYTAAKHGVLGLTRCAAMEGIEQGVRVNALITGNVDTALYRRLSGVDASAPLPPAPNPTGRVATADEVASLVAYLLSDETTFMTGAAAGLRQS